MAHANRVSVSLLAAGLALVLSAPAGAESKTPRSREGRTTGLLQRDETRPPDGSPRHTGLPSQGGIPARRGDDTATTGQPPASPPHTGPPWLGGMTSRRGDDTATTPDPPASPPHLGPPWLGGMASQPDGEGG